ncbi:MAG: hypothetical protein QE269_04345 [Fimbriimonas sp.]|nr:hypothetical protein [Fimbriimonas sp.]
MKKLIVLLAVVASIGGNAQDISEFKKPTPKVVKSTTAPVTRSEAHKVLDRAWTVLAKGLKLPSVSPVLLVGGGEPVTKNEILTEFARLANASAKQFKRSPRPASFDATRLRKDCDATQLKFLVSKGLVMPLGPLVTGNNGPVSTAEFGDAVGVLVTRLADLCHLPSTQYSPNLMPG